MKFIKAIILIIGLGVGALQAQNAVPTTGGEATGSGGTASYTIGQVAYSTNSGTSGTATQGVQQPYEISTTLGTDLKKINLELKVYPNPSTGILYLKIEGWRLSELSYQLLNIQGKLIEQHVIADFQTSIDMHSHARAVYLLNVHEKDELIKTFRIIKN